MTVAVADTGIATGFPDALEGVSHNLEAGADCLKRRWWSQPIDAPPGLWKDAGDRRGGLWGRR